MRQLQKQRLSTFCKENDIPLTTAYDWINYRNFPAEKIVGRWYIDPLKVRKWLKLNR